MKGNNSGLLLPLGIGAALLLLLSKKSKSSKEEMTDAASVVPQLQPEPAPEYTLPTAKPTNAAAEADDGEDGDDEEPQESDPYDMDSGYEDSNDTTYSSSGSSGNSTARYPPGYTPSTGYRPAIPPVYSPIPVAKQTNVPIKSLRFSSDQAKRLTAIQKLRGNSPYIGKGKPPMGVQLPVAYKPVVTSASQQPIVLTPGNTVATKPGRPVPKAATIFPLKFGQRNTYIKEVQKKIGVSATGYFGTQTRARLQKRFGVAEVNEVLYKQITIGKMTAPALKKRIMPYTVKKYRPVIRKK